MLQSPKFRISPQLVQAAKNNPALRVGARGDGVKRLQEALVFAVSGLQMPNSISRHGGYDGIYGQETKSAVYQFQTGAGIGRDGVAGEETVTTLDQVLPQTLGHSFTVPGKVPALKMTDSYDCWAVSYTILLRWKHGSQIAVRDAVASVGSDYLKLYDKKTSLPPAKFKSFLKDSGLRSSPSKPYSAVEWTQLIRRNGLLWVGAFRSMSDQRLHSRLVEGYITDETDGGTELMILDPDNTNGSRYNEPFSAFVAKFNAASRPNYPQIRHF